MKDKFQYIKFLISKACLKKAIEVYSILDENKANLLSFRYYFYYNALLKGNISFETFSIHCNRIAKDFLLEINHYKEQLSTLKKINTYKLFMQTKKTDFFR